MVNRLAYKLVSSPSSWTCPSGVTRITVQPVSSTGGTNTQSSCFIVDVVPDTTYVITETLNFGSIYMYALGSVFDWYNYDKLLIIYME